ncbi:MAG: cysteine hydrolase [Alphaproteobacteria bacterium]|nr:cysteine hydrolase [Alphaproteobacteria bacterium]
MAQADLSEEYVERVTQLRDRRHVFTALDPAATALVVIDMQNAFVAEGAPFEVPAARAIVPAINRVAAALRSAAGRVVWVQATQGKKGTAQYFELFFENFLAPAGRERAHAAVSEGHPLHALYPALDVRGGDRIVNKCRPSAFIQGASDIETFLRGQGIGTVLIAGTATNVCCESSARDAAMLGFRVIMIADANASHSDVDHVAGLSTMLRYFGDVRSAAETIALIETGAAAVRRTG